MLVVDVSLTCRTRRRGRRLALPVDACRANRVIAVPRRRRKSADALVEREGKQVCPTLLVPPHARLPCWRNCAATDTEGSKDLQSRVSSMCLKRYVRGQPARPRHMRNASVEQGQELAEFSQDLRVSPHLLYAFQE